MPSNPIQALDYNAKFIGMDEVVVIHKKQPDGLHELVTTVHKNLCCSSFTKSIMIKVLYCVRKLVNELENV